MAGFKDVFIDMERLRLNSISHATSFTVSPVMKNITQTTSTCFMPLNSYVLLTPTSMVPLVGEQYIYGQWVGAASDECFNLTGTCDEWMTPDPANGDVIVFFAHDKLIPNNKGLPHIIILENGKAELDATEEVLFAASPLSIGLLKEQPESTEILSDTASMGFQKSQSVPT
ncbi:hypothetical protein BO85DRAFT_433834 [Aspergillus piperis CBS 112811]|uniref:Uncharacterized protein n=1 Tax=Aspergillus piperis CBS 112811 TaxID=1448313 RepID=A0A8G1RCF5_9EURO|nr:hypothetical protein BO85DRAFT_433834 [Aspergillus piperis CBS 112811]RAH63303.1 hypothetical protein BO85DRAFT_433834 [Aspergillus piperis CBS 112811]